MTLPFAVCPAYGGHVEQLSERPVVHQQRDPDAAAAVGQHEHEAEEPSGRPQSAQPAGGRTGRSQHHDLVRTRAERLVTGGRVPLNRLLNDCVCCSVILDSPVTEQEFLEQLHELNSKINYAKELSFRETLACSDIQDIVDRLKIKVRADRRSTRLMIPSFFVERINAKHFLPRYDSVAIPFAGRLKDP